MNPYLSFVVGARNDDYGGNFLNRLTTHLRVLDELCSRYELKAESIIVDYNPPTQVACLADAVREVFTPRYISLRFITVPNSFHTEFENSDRNPLFEYIAKNIGVRRARAPFVIAMNPDIVVSEELIAHLAQNSLSEECFYRVNRHDITPMYIDPSLSVDEVLTLCKQTTAKILYPLKTEYLSYGQWLYRFIHGRTYKSFMLCPLFNGFTESKRGLDTVHENAAGDFTLAHRTAWDRSGGYEESPLGSALLDGYLLYVFYCLGYKQSILPYSIYHIEHQYGKAGRPMAILSTYRERAQKMLSTHVPYKELPTDWGFPSEIFSEVILSPGNNF